MNSVLSREKISVALEPVFRVYNIRRAILFGSYAKNTADKNSDVDLYVESDLRGLRFVGFTESVKDALGGREVDIFDRAHLEDNSRVLNEINNTGVLVYER